VAYDGYEALRIDIEGGVARATIEHPPINLLDLQLLLELDTFSREVEADDEIKVVVLESSDDEFFIAHADVELILRIPRDAPSEAPTELGLFHAMVERYRAMPKLTIAVIDGIARGGGAEVASSFDLRFASLERGVLSQPEVALGIIPGGSGTQRLPRLVGRARALEIVVGCMDVDAATAERWGWVNRALPRIDLRPFVDALTSRIAAMPATAIAAAKRSVDVAVGDPVPGLLREWQLFTGQLAQPEVIALLQRFLELGGQTREAELDLDRLLAALGESG
jgi:enoyl-CoA hydratase/carnithine racemase